MSLLKLMSPTSIVLDQIHDSEIFYFISFTTHVLISQSEIIVTRKYPFLNINVFISITIITCRYGTAVNTPSNLCFHRLYLATHPHVPSLFHVFLHLHPSIPGSASLLTFWWYPCTHFFKPFFLGDHNHLIPQC